MPEALGVSTRRLNRAAESAWTLAVSGGCQVCTISRAGRIEHALASAATQIAVTSARAPALDPIDVFMAGALIASA
jgi:hypothetical protein